jgi:hypothetical protein
MAKVQTIKCDCNIQHKTLKGDFTRWQLAIRYNGQIAEGYSVREYEFYCCGKCMYNSSAVFMCGRFLVGHCCTDNHDSDNLVDIYGPDLDSDQEDDN